MNKINNLNDLQNERIRLRSQLLMAEEALSEDLIWVKQEIEPGRIIVRLISHLFNNKKETILGEGARFGIETLIRNIFLSKAGWITRLIVPVVFGNVSSTILSDKKPEVLGILKNLIRKVRHQLKKDEPYFDKTTADEMDY